MKPARIIMLLFALGAGVLAYVVADAPQPVVREAGPRAPDTEEILVAGADWPVSKFLTEADLVWKPWPVNLLQPGMIRRNGEGDPMAELRGAFVRQPIMAGEPVRREKLLRVARSGYVAATLAPGLRAIAIPVDPQGLATAGGFVMPNDRVDVLGAARTENTETRLILANVRVLAIGPNLAERPGERVLNGATATLEVTPEQGEILLQAQRGWSLVLALRAISDAPAGAPQTSQESIVSVIRYGAQGAK